MTTVYVRTRAPRTVSEMRLPRTLPTHCYCGRIRHPRSSCYCDGHR